MSPRALATAMSLVAIAAIAVALWALRRPPPPPEPSGVASVPNACDCGADAGPGERPPAAATASPPLTRYVICPREESPPRWARVALWGADRLVVHCGSSVHVIGFDRTANDARPLRMARIQAPAPDPGTAPRAVAPAAGDFDGDGEPDLVVPMLWAEATGTPRSGALYLLPGRREGGFGPARRVVEVAAAAIALGEQDGRGPLELAALHVPGPGRASELWVLSGGPAPRRLSHTPIGIGEGWVAWADVDGDGREEPLAAVVSRAGVHGVGPSASADAGTDDALDSLAAGRGGVGVDVAGDGRRELLALGERAWLVKDGRVQGIEGSQGLQQLDTFDLDGDGHRELIGHDDQVAVVLEAQPDGHFARRELLRIGGDHFTPIGLVALHVDADARADYLVLATTAGPDPQVELGVVRGAADPVAVVASSTSSALPDAILSLRLTLP